MPIGNQSLQNFQSTVYTTDLASVYKAKRDADASIASNIAGAFYVYPNNPAAMNVLVDDGFNFPVIGGIYSTSFSGASSPNVVSLTAPGANSYFGCVYFDLTTSTTGVVYGATNVTPVPVTPDQIWRVPLAQVLLTAGQVTVVA